MRKKKNLWMLMVVLVVTVFVSGLANAKDVKDVKTTFYGYQWLRYTNVVLGDDIQNISQFSLPRTYLRWKIENKEAGWSGQITLDINSVRGGQEIGHTVTNTSATDADGTGTTITVTHTHTYDRATGRVDFAIWPKYAYIDFSKIPFLSDLEVKLRLGIQKNYFGTIDRWDYVLIERTITDLRRVMSSADFGVALLGDLPDGWGQYELAMHSGSGYKVFDANVEKQYTSSLMLVPLSGLMLRGSYMINNQAAHGRPERTLRTTGVVAQYSPGFLPIPVTILGEYVVVNNPLNAGIGRSGCSVGYMIFGYVDVLEWLTLAARYDNWNPDTFQKNDEQNLYIAGINIKINENYLLQLNYQLEQPQFGGYAHTAHRNTWMAQTKWSW